MSHFLSFQRINSENVNIFSLFPYLSTVNKWKGHLFYPDWPLPIIQDSGYPHDGHADKNPYPHARRADKDSYVHESNNQCIILRLQLSFVLINVQLMLV